MDISYNLVASKCADQMSKYQKCVLANQNRDWATQCEQQGKELSQCAQKKVPQLEILKSTCAQPIRAYAECMHRYRQASDTEVAAECETAIKDLWECSEAVMKKAELDLKVFKLDSESRI